MYLPKFTRGGGCAKDGKGYTIYESTLSDDTLPNIETLNTKVPIVTLLRDMTYLCQNTLNNNSIQMKSQYLTSQPKPFTADDRMQHIGIYVLCFTLTDTKATG